MPGNKATLTLACLVFIWSCSLFYSCSLTTTSRCTECFTAKRENSRKCCQPFLMGGKWLRLVSEGEREGERERGREERGRERSKITLLLRVTVYGPTPLWQ